MTKEMVNNKTNSKNVDDGQYEKDDNFVSEDFKAAIEKGELTSANAQKNTKIYKQEALAEGEKKNAERVGAPKEIKSAELEKLQLEKLQQELEEARKKYAKTDLETGGALAGIAKTLKWIKTGPGDIKEVNQAYQDYQAKVMSLLGHQMNELRTKAKDKNFSPEQITKMTENIIKYFGTDEKMNLWDARTKARSEKRKEKYGAFGSLYDGAVKFMEGYQKVNVKIAKFGSKVANWVPDDWVKTKKIVGIAGGMAASATIGVGLVVGGIYFPPLLGLAALRRIFGSGAAGMAGAGLTRSFLEGKLATKSKEEKDEILKEMEKAQDDDNERFAVAERKIKAIAGGYDEDFGERKKSAAWATGVGYGTAALAYFAGPQIGKFLGWGAGEIHDKTYVGDAWDGAKDLARGAKDSVLGGANWMADTVSSDLGAADLPPGGGGGKGGVVPPSEGGKGAMPADLGEKNVITGRGSSVESTTYEKHLNQELVDKYNKQHGSNLNSKQIAHRMAVEYANKYADGKLPNVVWEGDEIQFSEDGLRLEKVIHHGQHGGGHGGDDLNHNKIKGSGKSRTEIPVKDPDDDPSALPPESFKGEKPPASAPVASHLDTLPELKPYGNRIGEIADKIADRFREIDDINRDHPYDQRFAKDPIHEVTYEDRMSTLKGNIRELRFHAAEEYAKMFKNFFEIGRPGNFDAIKNLNATEHVNNPNSNTGKLARWLVEEKGLNKDVVKPKGSETIGGWMTRMAANMGSRTLGNHVAPLETEGVWEDRPMKL